MVVRSESDPMSTATNSLAIVHPENNPYGHGLEYAKAYAVATGGHRAGVLESSFVAEVKSDLMGEQTILCGVLQTGSILSFDKMVEKGVDPGYAAKLIQYGWETITEALKHGGITNMMDRLSNPAKIKAFYMRLNDDQDTVRAMDILFPGIGEIVGGSQREERLEVLKDRIKKQGIDEKELWWYLDLRKYGTVKHSGFGLGLERLILFITGMNNIRDVIPFPRTPKNAEF